MSDSIKNIVVKINTLKSVEIKKMIKDSYLKATLRNEAELKKTASPLSEKTPA